MINAFARESHPGLTPKLPAVRDDIIDDLDELSLHGDHKGDLTDLDKRRREIDKFYRRHEFHFDENSWDDIKEYLETCDEVYFRSFLTHPWKDPNQMFWYAFPLGIFGVDRFVLGEVGLGIVKALTLGQFLIGMLVDMGTIHQRTRSHNYEAYLRLKLGPHFR